MICHVVLVTLRLLRSNLVFSSVKFVFTLLDLTKLNSLTKTLFYFGNTVIMNRNYLIFEEILKEAINIQNKLELGCAKLKARSCG